MSRSIQTDCKYNPLPQIGPHPPPYHLCRHFTITPPPTGCSSRIKTAKLLSGR